MKGKLRFHFVDPGSIEEFHVVEPIGLGIGLELGQLGRPRRIQCHQQLAAAPVADAVFGAELIEKLLAAKHQPGLEAAGNVVDSGVNAVQSGGQGVTSRRQDPETSSSSAGSVSTRITASSM